MGTITRWLAGAMVVACAGGGPREGSTEPPSDAAPSIVQDATTGSSASTARSTEANPASAPAEPAPKRTISASVDRHATSIVRSHMDPCSKADESGHPCFPASVEAEGISLSVKDGLRDYQPDLRLAPGVPTSAELSQYMSGAPLSASGGVSTDPVCAVKSLIRQIGAGSNAFFLYRLEVAGEAKPLLTDHKLDPMSYLSVPGARLEFLGRYDGECEAIAAWRKAVRGEREAEEKEKKTSGIKVLVVP